MDADREALRQCLDRWHAHEPATRESVSGTGCLSAGLIVFGTVLLFALYVGACVALVYGLLEEYGDHDPGAAPHIEGAQGAQGDARREGQDVRHGGHGAADRGGRA